MSKTRRRGLAVVAAASVSVLTAALLIGGGESGQGVVDNDPAAAEAHFSTGSPCPGGELIRVSQWERSASRSAEIEEHYGLEKSPLVMVDQYSIKLSELPADAPEEAVGAVAVCVKTADGMMDTGFRSWIVDVPAEPPVDERGTS